MFALCKHASIMNKPNITFQTYLAKTGTRQSDLADAVGVTRGHMSSLNAGLKKPSLKVAADIERVSGGLVPAASWHSPPTDAGAA